MRPGVPPLCNGVGTVPPWPDSRGRGLNFPAEMPAVPPLGMTGWHEVCSTFTSKPRCVGPTPAETRAQGTAHCGPRIGADQPPSLHKETAAPAIPGDAVLCCAERLCRATFLPLCGVMARKRPIGVIRGLVQYLGHKTAPGRELVHCDPPYPGKRFAARRSDRVPP